MHKMKVMILTVCAFATILIGCNTVQGVGKDVQRGGEAIENVAK